MRKSLLSLLFAILCLSTFAQTKEFSKINQAFLKNSGIIESKEGQSGYYFFYQYDKVAKGKYTYILELVDANYKPIRKINIQRPKYDLLLECAYNGSNFFITFVTKKYEMEVLSYSNEGKKIGSKITGKLSKIEFAYVRQKANSDLASNNIIPIGKEGVIKLNFKPYSKEKFNVECYDNSLKTKWKYTSENKEKLFETPECLYSSNKYILLSVSKFKSKLDLEITQHLILLDAVKGVKIFDQKLNSTKNKKLYINTFIDEDAGELVVIGEYYNNKDNVNKAKSLGLFLNKYDTTGKLVTSKELAWGKDFKKFVKLNPNGTNEDGAFTYFHKIIKTSDDKYFIIGEQYKKSVSALGIATVILSKGQSGGVMNFDILDMIVMEMDSAFNIQQLKSYEKKKNSVNLEGGYSYLAPPAISRMMAMYGYFDYLFTSIDKANNKFYASYLSSEKNKETNKKDGYIGTIGYDNGLIHDKLVIKSDANTIRIMQGKPGYVTFLEYYKKKKIMKARLEKINLE